MASKNLKNNKPNKGTTKKLSTAQIFFIVFSVILVLSMILSLFAKI
jgi:hypothetical protein